MYLHHDLGNRIFLIDITVKGLELQVQHLSF